MAEKASGIGRLIPDKGLHFDLPEGKTLTRLHLDAGPDGLTLATAGAATATLSKGNRQRVTLKRATDGITLSVVGAASATSKK